jgi:hypothetical protein
MPEPLHPSVDAGHQRSDAAISAVLPRWLVKLSRPSRMLWLGPLLGFLLTIPSFFSGYIADLQLMTATIEKVTPNGRPRVVSFAFKKDLAEFSWMKWTKEGPKPCQVPPPGGEIRLFATLF